MAWTTPKTNWVESDAFNISDYNRIKNNLKYIYDNAQLIWGDFSITDMGSDLISYAGYWDTDKFNAIENNLKTINEHMLNADIGFSMTFYPNGAFITASELNRIEKASLTLKATIDGWYEGMEHLKFRLGNKGGIK